MEVSKKTETEEGGKEEDSKREEKEREGEEKYDCLRRRSTGREEQAGGDSRHVARPKKRGETAGREAEEDGNKEEGKTDRKT